ncbi:hypothetical protein BC835DRAFT_1272959 [Cytidiella melzeri]|nr:hypothetical protein BC835DRAFT_1272959 [Cytidiella melzeri]
MNVDIDSQGTHTALAQPNRPPVVPLSPLTHIAFFTAILAPAALLPYLAVRRHLISLHRKVAEVGVANAALQRDLKTALLEAAIRREEYDRLLAMISEARTDMEKLRTDENRRELARTRMQVRTRRDVEDLLMERQRTRTGLAHLRDLSASMADIAAFMHEVEVQQGFVSRKNDGRGIERIRQLAYKLQRIVVDDSDKVCDVRYKQPCLCNEQRKKLQDATLPRDVPKDH